MDRVSKSETMPLSTWTDDVSANPMPFHGLASMTDANLLAIFDDLKRQPATWNAVPDASVASR